MNENFRDDIDVDSNFDTLGFMHNNGVEYYTSDQLANEFKAVMHDEELNLSRNHAKLLAYFESLNEEYDVICLTETRRKQCNYFDIFLPRYNSYHSV